MTHHKFAIVASFLMLAGCAKQIVTTAPTHASKNQIVVSSRKEPAKSDKDFAVWPLHVTYPASATYINWKLQLLYPGDKRCTVVSSLNGLNVYDRNNLTVAIQFPNNSPHDDKDFSWYIDNFGARTSTDSIENPFHAMAVFTIHRNPVMHPNGDLVLASAYKSKDDKVPSVILILNISISQSHPE